VYGFCFVKERERVSKYYHIPERIFSTAFATTKFFVVLRPMTGLSSLFGTKGLGDLTRFRVNLEAEYVCLSECFVYMRERDRVAKIW